MSDYIIKIIPTNPCYHMDTQKICSIEEYLKVKIKADTIEIKTYNSPIFIDCGSNLEKIICPICVWYNDRF